MTYRKNLGKYLTTSLIGLALFATPVIAAAQNHDNGKHDSHQSQPQSNNHQAPSHSDRAPAHMNAPAHNNGPSMAPRHEQANMSRNEPAMAPRHEFHDQRASNNHNFNAAPAVETHRDFRSDRRETVATRQDFHGDRHEGRWEGRDHDHDRWNHDHPDYAYDNDRRWGPYYTGGPNYLMPEGYAGGSCGWARHLRAVYIHDEYTGHPAAANDVLWRARRAERACGLRYGYNGYYSGYRYYR